MRKNLFTDDEAFLSFDFGSQGITAMYTLPATGKIITADIDFTDKFPELNLTEDGFMNPQYDGQGFQSVLMYLTAFEKVIRKIRRKVEKENSKGMSLVKRIAMDGQQHGGIYLNEDAPDIFKEKQKELIFDKQ